MSMFPWHRWYLVFVFAQPYLLVLFTPDTEYHGLGTAVATVMLQCLIMSSTAEVQNLLVSHIDATFL